MFALAVVRHVTTQGGSHVMALRLHVIPTIGQSFDFIFQGVSLTIGRSLKSDLVIDDQEISRLHARIFIKGKDVFLEDLDSHNGTILDGQLIQCATSLNDGAVIKLSNSVIVVHDQAIVEGKESSASESVISTIYRKPGEILDEAEAEPTTSGNESEEARILRHHAERLKMLNDIHQVLSKPIARDVLLDLILDRAFVHLHPEEGTIFLRESGVLVPAARKALPDLNKDFLYSRSLVQEVADKGLAALVLDTKTDIRFSESQSIHAAGVRSLVAAPLLDDEGSLGMIVLVSRVSVRKFTEEDMALLVSLASIAAMRIRNIALVEKSRQQLLDMNRVLEEKVAERTRELEESYAELESLDDIVKATNREMELPRILDTMLEQGLILFPKAQQASFLLRNGTNFRFVATLGRIDQPEGEVLSLEAVTRRFMTGADEIGTGIYLKHHPEERGPASENSPRSTLTMILNPENRPEGLLIFDNFCETDAFDHSDARKLDRFHEHAIPAVAKARYLQELKETNEDLIKRRNQLIVQEKMASLGALTAGIAHSIKNPLNFVHNLALIARDTIKELRQELAPQRQLIDADSFGFIVDLLRDLELNAQVAEEQGKRANQTIDSMMALSSTGAGEKATQLTDINSLLAKYVTLTYQGCLDNDETMEIDLQFDRDPELPLIPVHPRNLSRAFVNLTKNAIEAIREKKERSNDDYLPHIIAVTCEYPKEIEIRIRDNGLGIPEKNLSEVMTPFFTTRSPTENMGLGLSICYDIVQEHQGELSLASGEGEFTEVTIRLPKEPTRHEPVS